MKISEFLKTGNKSFSFEFFPPKDSEGFDKLHETIKQLKEWAPSFVSVTYGAGGSTRNKTVDLVGRIKNEIGLESMAHLTCVGSDRDELRSVLDSLREKGIENVLPLRGDPPQGETEFQAVENGFSYANELVAFIKEHYSFCLGVAGYPEGHVECPDKDLGLNHLRLKVDAGADFIITQLFFDNDFFFDFCEKAQAKGIQVPIIAGIMPILNVKQIKRFTKMCGATIPDSLLNHLEKHQEDPQAVRQIGIDHAIKQSEDLISQGSSGIHFYTLNRSNATREILKVIKA